MNLWRALPERLARQGDQVLVTVAAVRGSAPREAGASMLVDAHDCCDTIGGGRLEWEAIAHAHRMLGERAGTPELLRFPLGASLGQCCGGVVRLLFERIDAGELPAWRERAAALARGECLVRRCGAGSPSEWDVRGPEEGRKPEEARAPESGVSLHHGAAAGPSAAQDAAWVFEQTIVLPDFPVVIFGAGHVGEAIVRALLPLEAQMRWVDTREDAFPADLAPHVECIATDAPEREMREAPRASMVLVLTHSHAIDLELCAAGLRRDDLTFFGLIGSHAKRARFEQRLVSRGLNPLRLARLVCPIGVAGIRSKLPAAIAVAVVAQLLQVREQGMAAPAACAPNIDTITATVISC